MRTVRLAGVLLVLSTMGAGALRAQTRVELGIDMGYERTSVPDSRVGNPVLSVFAAPMQSLRVGFYVQDGISFEPRLGITRVSTEGVSSTQVRTAVAGLFHLGASAEGSTYPFLLLLTGLDYANAGIGGNSVSTVQLRVGGGAGIMAAILDRLSFRASAEYHRSFESRDALATNRVLVAVGLSWFTR